MSRVSVYTALFLLLSLLVVGCIDVYGLTATPGQDTVSSTIVRWSRDYPILPFAIGVIMGHLFFPQRG